MNTSSSTAAGRLFPVSSLLYRDVGEPLPPVVAEPELRQEAAAGVSEQEVGLRVAAARAEALAEASQRFADQLESERSERLAKVLAAIESFEQNRREYFDKVESDVVHLALAIAAKILHREAQVDPMLLGGLVRYAIEQLHDGSTVTVRVPPAKAAVYRAFLTNTTNGSRVNVMEDDNLAEEDCVLETDLGSANFSIDAQLKEIERGFFDLIAHRPAIK